jgi:hypothetical protein
VKPFDLGGIRWWPSRGSDDDALRETLAAALAAVADGRAANQKHGRRKALYLLALGKDDATTHLLKVNRYGARDGFRRRLGKSKARRELALAETIAERGIATPVPLAAGEARRGGRVRACYLLVPFVAGAADLRRRFALPLESGERRALAASLGRFARAVHDAAISQDDFQPNNFLLGPGGSGDLRLIDCERVALRAKVPADEAAWQLAKLEREVPAASLADRARFVAAYTGARGRAARAARRELWQRVALARLRLARHDGARIARAIGARGRRFPPLALAGWRGVANAGALSPEIAASVGAALAAAPPVLALVPAGGAFALGLPPGLRREHERALATAVVLARRGLAPEPVALLRRAREGCLVFAGALPARLAALSTGERRARRGALVGLLARLSGLGRLAPPRSDQVGLAGAVAPIPLTFLAPPLLDLDGRAEPVPRAALRALAAKILGGGAS